MAEDSSVNARDLTNNNSTPYVLAKLNNGADLEKSSSQYFSRSNGGDYDTTAGTLSCWIKPETLDPSPGNPSIFSNATNVGTGGVEFGVAVHNGDVLFGYLGAGNQAVLGSTALSTNTWYMVTFTWDSSGKELFLNAVSDGTNTVDETLTAGETNISIGRNQKYNMNYFDGITDECGMWNRVLTGTEIATLYNSGTGMSYSSIESTETPLQDISYDYDANGNISQISENATSTAGRTVVYTYDDLNRLTSASTTAASSTPFRQTFSYDILGNLTGWKTGSGATSTYTYAGTGYVNPHAPTSVNGVTHSYDNNGNLTSAGSRNFNWNYRNTIASIATSTATTTYGYDHANQRVQQYVPTVGTTTYPSRFYDRLNLSSAATTTSYIYAGDLLVATVEGNGTATSTRYMHPDHLGSTNVVTNASGTPVQVLEYYPYGSLRSETGSDVSNREFIGQITDEATNLSYLNARYYDGPRGQFLSQDPMFLTIPNKQNLRDPQSFNSYSYGQNNPVSNSDPTGKCIYCAGFEVAYSLVAQALFDSAVGVQSSPAVYGGNVVGASLYGSAYLYAVAFPEPLAAASGGVANAAQQGFEYLAGDRTSFNVDEIRSAAAISLGTQLAVGSLPIPIMSGSALSKQISTKLQKGSISNVSNATLTKINISNGPGSVVQNYATNFTQSTVGAVSSNQSIAQTASRGVSMSLSYSSTVSMAQTAISLAKAFIAAYKKQ